MGERTTSAPASASSSDWLYRTYEKTGFLPIMLVALVVILALFVPHFLALQNIFNVLRSSSYLVIMAAGQMLVLIVGGFDLSVGGVVALTSVTSAMVMAGLKDPLADEPGVIIVLGVAAGIGSGLAVGLVNGLCVAFLRISPFMVTLGTMSIATGVALLLTNGIPVYGMPKAYVDGFGEGAMDGTSDRGVSGGSHRRAGVGDAELHPHGPIHLGHRWKFSGGERFGRARQDLSDPRLCHLFGSRLGVRARADRADWIGPGHHQLAADPRKHSRRRHRRRQLERRCWASSRW